MNNIFKNLRDGSQIIFTIFLLFTFSFIAKSQASGNNIICDFSSINIAPSDAHILTLKFKNIIEQQGLLLVFVSDLKGSADSLPVECNNLQTAKKIRELTHADLILWGNVGKIDNTYICSVYKLSSVDSKDVYEVFQEEISGQLSDVLKYSIQNLAMKVSGHPENVIKKPETVVAPQEIAGQGAVQSVAKGWLKISSNDENCKLYIDGEPAGTGEQEIELSTGTHKVVAKNETETLSKLVEIFKNDNSAISFDFDYDKNRNIRFYMSFDASWMLGDGIEFGPSHTVGIEIQKKHLFAINYYWGFPEFGDEIYGGGLQYMYSFNMRDIFIARVGGCAGFWRENTWRYYDSYNNSNGYYYNYDRGYHYFFGGPRVRLEIGYKHVFFNMIDATCLIGDNGVPKAMLNSGISLRF